MRDYLYFAFYQNKHFFDSIFIYYFIFKLFNFDIKYFISKIKYFIFKNNKYFML